MSVLLAVLLFAAEPTIQFDLSAGATGPAQEEETPDEDAVKRDASQGAAYLGLAFEARRNRWNDNGMFFGAGVEGTIDGKEGPYQWSVGFGPRVGYVVRTGELDFFPDGYLYARATPFFGMRSVASEEYLHDDTRRLTRSGGGVRLGVGFTVPRWSATVMSGMGDADLSGMQFSNPLEVLGCLALGVAIVLFNHVELTYETYYAAGMPPDHRVGIRFGTGF